MGELGGFLKCTVSGSTSATRTSACTTTASTSRSCPTRGAARAGRALHGLRRPVLPRGLPARQPDPGLERPRLPRPLARGDRPAPRHQQLPRVHRPDLPGAVRAGLRARRSTTTRSRSSRSSSRSSSARWEEGWVVPRAARGAHRPQRRASSAPGPPASRPPPQLNRAGHEVTVYERDEGAGGLHALRRARLQAREVDHRPPRRLLEAEGVALRLRRRRGHGRRPPRSCAPARRGGARDRLARAPRPRRARAATSTGVHFAMDYLYQRNRWVAKQRGARAHRPAEQPISAARQARGRDRRRRHGRWTASPTRTARAPRA